MSNKEVFDQIAVTKEIINKVSPAFCTAKWLQSTVLLYNGQTHSCHHPARHNINPDDLKGNPKGIHNTPIKIYARKEMLQGIQTKECDYCWRIENSNHENYSDRIYKSASPWSLPHLEKVKSSGLGEDINPTYLEVAFENTCNFMCMYCTPDVTSRMMEDVEKHGPYKLHTTHLHDLNWIKNISRMPIHRDDYNPYTEAFWEWWPELSKTLEVFRITGGEPLLSKHTWKIFDYLKTNKIEKLEFAINTNLGVPDKLIDKLIDEIKQVQHNVKEVKIFTSTEAAGSHAEYIRFGMDYYKFIENIDRIMTELPNVRIVFMTTVNALSLFSFKDFLEDVLVLRAKHFKTAAESTLGVSINYLRWPTFQDIRIISRNIKKSYTDELLNFVYAHKEKTPLLGEALFYLEEIDQIERLVKYAMQEIPNRDDMKKDFKLFYQEYDKRKKLDFSKTFPEIAHMVK